MWSLQYPSKRFNQSPNPQAEGDFSIRSNRALSSANKKEQVQKLPLLLVTS